LVVSHLFPSIFSVFWLNDIVSTFSIVLDIAGAGVDELSVVCKEPRDLILEIMAIPENPG
jgi:hypothetical protein